MHAEEDALEVLARSWRHLANAASYYPTRKAWISVSYDEWVNYGLLRNMLTTLIFTQSASQSLLIAFLGNFIFLFFFEAGKSYLRTAAQRRMWPTVYACAWCTAALLSCGLNPFGVKLSLILLTWECMTMILVRLGYVAVLLPSHVRSRRTNSQGKYTRDRPINPDVRPTRTQGCYDLSYILDEFVDPFAVDDYDNPPTLDNDY